MPEPALPDAPEPDAPYAPDGRATAGPPSGMVSSHSPSRSRVASRRRGVRDTHEAEGTVMDVSHEVQQMVCIHRGPNNGPAPIPEEGRWVQAREIKDISGLTHGVGWCAPQQGACKLTLNVKKGIIEEALVETVGCTGMTHSAAMAAEILPGKTILEALNVDWCATPSTSPCASCSCRSPTGARRRRSPRTACPSGRRWRTWARGCAA